MGRAATHVILGAGCAGLSLALALREAGLGAPILLLDRRTAFARDRTWCLWATTPPPRFAGLATHAWPAWQVIGPDGTVSRQGSSRTPYLRLVADDVYADARARLAGHPDVELRLGVRVTAVEPGRDHVDVRTTRGTVRAAHVYDALGGGGPLARDGRRRDRGGLLQTFLGQEVRTAAPVFDTGAATLMDFRIDQGRGGVRFVYVLPLAPDRALVEDTSIGTHPRTAAERRAAIARHLRDHHGTRIAEVEHEERGTIPMSTVRRPVRLAPRLTAVGLAGGAARPSSGYAFARIQQQVDAVARAVVAGGSPPVHAGSARLELMDRVFLDALRGDPGAFPQAMAGLLRGAPAEVVARFMNDASSPADELRLAAAMPVLPFARAAVAGAPGLLAALSSRRAWRP